MPTEFPAFELLPASDEDFSPDEELAGIIDPDEIPERDREDDVLPLGSSWAFDFDAGQMGSRPLPVHGTDAVVMWAQVALRTQRYRWPIFSSAFGMTSPDLLIGEPDDVELRAVYITDITETLSVHDRITNVGDFLFIHDEDEEIAYLDVTLEIDGDESVRLEGIPL